MCNIPNGFISDMLIFAPLPRDADIDNSTSKLSVKSVAFSSFKFPQIHSASVTKHLATVVVECYQCKLFCTKSLDSIVPYEPVEFVSENGSCSGWMSFGSFDKSQQFSFRSSGNEGRLDPMAVVLYPSSTIGRVLIPGFPTQLSGRVKITGGNGISVSADKATNSIVLSLDNNLSNLYSDPCNRDSSSESQPVCNVSGVSPKDGTIVLAFTGGRLTDTDVDSLLAALENYDIGQNQLVEIQAGIYKEQRSDGTVHDYIAVSVKAKPQPRGVDPEEEDPEEEEAEEESPGSGFEVVGYRLSYGVSDQEIFGLSTRDVEFSTGTGYHRPQYDVWTRKDFLPPLAELYRSIEVVPDDESLPIIDIAVEAGELPWDDDSENNRFTQHQYESNHISSSRYDIENSTVIHSRVIDDNGNPYSSITPAVVADPYDFTSQVVQDGEKIVFLHRIQNSVPSNMVSSIFVDVAYKPAGSKLISVIRRNIYVAS
jgi:hypothetical protein